MSYLAHSLIFRLGQDTVVFRKGARSSLATNSEKFETNDHRRARTKETNLETKIEKGTPAKRTTSDALNGRALENRLDLKLVKCEQET